ncbi:TIGR02300 family protein [Nordella sp. HKS 07]|uniref:TIGR02300 family protein n=1 Tax=Nordella sp. HKS 07 TaxID=2712222 RepID=UPI0013E186F5|nr:TIGR02300 family protein [Nordella sp. HKS 07]QIG48358.1 TIGR02300 family protein [Nordella sp. HKS 07]
MVKAELGTKRICPSCGSKFYDLLKSPIICPKCGVSFIAAPVLPSKGEVPQAVAKPRDIPKPAPEDADEVADVELVSLEEVDEGDDAEDETAAIADVDLGEEEDGAEAEEDSTFLVEDEEENSDVSGYLDSGPGGAKEGEEEP